MLQTKIRTAQEIETYMEELRSWLKEDRDTPAEEMGDFFSKRLDIYEDVHLGHWPEEYAHIADFLPEGLGSLLDIGCGTGLELKAIYQRFPGVRVTGIDLSPDMLGKLQRTYREKNFRAIAADYFEYPFEEEQYDAALSFETLHHFKYEKKKGIYQKLFRALKPGGCYVECDYMACCDEEERLCLEQYEYKRQKSGLPDGVFVHLDIPLTLEHQLELMRQAGFQAVDVLYQNSGTVILRAWKGEPMTEREKMLAGQLYDCGDSELLSRWHLAKNLVRDYNRTDSGDAAKKERILNELLGGRGANLWITAPFYVDYGNNIYFGNNCEVNMNCTFLDDNRIVIGDNALIAPNVQIYTAFHPTNARDRFGAPREDGSFEFCKTQTAPVVIGNNVWIGGGAIIMPGVTIGDNVVIGAGSVVTRDIPSDKIAYGNPCRVMRDNR